MNNLCFILRKTLVVAAGIGLACILCASSASIAAAPQARYSNELIPPLRLSEEDFKQGFHKTFQIPDFTEWEWEPDDSRSGTPSLSYTPGYLAPIRAVLNVIEKHVCGEENGRKKFLTYSLNWSGELDSTDEDPEGKFPAQGYHFVGDVPGFKCQGCDCKRLPKPMMAFFLWLMREGPDGKLHRVTCVEISISEGCLCYDPPHEPFGRHLELGFGPELSEAIEEEKSLALETGAEMTHK